MITLGKARKLRQMIIKAAESLADSDAYDVPELFPSWKPGLLYTVGLRLRYDGKLYRVEQEHTSQADWTPDVTPALYTEVAEPGTIPVWRQPIGAQDSYMMGDKVYYPDYFGDIWESVMDYNVFEPGVTGWEKLES